MSAIERYLEELAHALRRSPGRDRVLDEVREHLEDSAAAARILGLGEEAAEADAVLRMGPVRTVAGTRRRRVPLALAAVLAVGLAGSLALARSAGPTNLVGLAPAQRAQGRAAGPPVLSGLGSMRIVSLDPTTLAPQGAGVPLHTSNGATTTFFLGELPPQVAFGSPDGQRLGFVYDGAVQLLALRPLHRTGSIRFLPAAPTYGPTRWDQKRGSLDRVLAAAWLAGNRIAVLVQHQGPPYARHVTGRQVIVVNVGTRATTPIPIVRQGRVVTFTSAADRLVVLLCVNRRTALLSANVSHARARETFVGVPCTGGAMPAVTVRRDGGVAAVVGHDLAPAIVNLVSMKVSHLPRILRPGVVYGRVAARFTARGALAVTGAREIGRDHLDERGLGVTLVDIVSGRSRPLTAHGSSLLIAGDTIVVSGFADAAKGRGAGTGLTAFTSEGTPLWHADGRRLVTPFESGQRVYAPRAVKRHTIVDAYDLASGRQLAELYQRADGVRPITGAVDSTG